MKFLLLLNLFITLSCAETTFEADSKKPTNEVDEKSQDSESEPEPAIDSELPVSIPQTITGSYLIDCELLDSTNSESSTVGCVSKKEDLAKLDVLATVLLNDEETTLKEAEQKDGWQRTWEVPSSKIENGILILSLNENEIYRRGISNITLTVSETCSVSNCESSIQGALDKISNAPYFGECSTKDLICRKISINILISGKWESPDTTPVVLDWLTDSSHNIHIRTIGEARHNGEVGPTFYRLIPTQGDGFTVNSDYTIIDGIIITGLEGSSQAYKNEAEQLIITNSITY